MARISILVLTLLISFSGWGQTPANLQTIEQALAANQQLQGQYQQQRFIAGLSRPLTSSGDFYLIKNQALLWQQSVPFEQQTLMSQSGIDVYTNHVKQPQSSQQAKLSQSISQTVLALMSGDLKRQSELFDVRLNTEPQWPLWQLQLTPKGGMFAKVLANIEVSGNQGDVLTLKVMENSGDHTETRFIQTGPLTQVPELLKGLDNRESK
ncbi:LolA family protein [Paraferrimonas haliotis]|uniref:LolA family protein n=1 Tax=Paraferrimonas haliotis TaxID=2013866 RepID=UPI0015CCD442|nr:outer membrane lipoprotein carrier protein LolA [Paraferrimonas haliotis]